jgi:hypothetical protein
MARWFRSHTAKLDNSKVQRLPDTLNRAWDSLRLAGKPRANWRDR